MKSNSRISKGTLSQFRALVEDRIEELGGNVEACDKITASAEASYQDTNGIMGQVGDIWTVSDLRGYWDAEQMNDPVLSEYDSFDSWLKDTISHMTLIASASDEAISAARDDDSTYDDRFIHTLIGDIESEVSGEVEGLTFDTLENALNVTVVHGDKVTELNVPHADLSFDFNTMDKDVDYIVSAIKEVLDSDLDSSAADSVETATNTSGISPNPKVLFSDQVVEDVIEADVDTDKLSNPYDYDDDEISASFAEIATKSVPDSDGFSTDYTMYRDTNTGEYVFVFGDRDIYSPIDGNFDWSCESEEEAWDWFNSYQGFTDEDDEFGE